MVFPLDGIDEWIGRRFGPFPFASFASFLTGRTVRLASAYSVCYPDELSVSPRVRLSHGNGKVSGMRKGMRIAQPRFMLEERKPI